MKNFIINLTFPVLTRILIFFVWLSELPLKWQNERNRRKVLKRNFENMTDPTFLDRALAGEEKSE